MKKEYIILAVIIVALGLYLILRSNDRTHYDLPGIVTPEKEQITRIEVAGPSGTIVLERADDVWLSEPEGYPVDRNKVDGMLDALSGLDLVSLVSEAESYSQYDLGEDMRVSVTASERETPLMRIDIGKAASTFRHTYVKFPDDRNVYQASGNIRRTFDVEIGAIRDKQVLKLDRNSITGLTLDSGGEKLALVKTTKPVEPESEESGVPAQEVTAWVTADGLEADGSVVDGILGRIVNLQCDGFPGEGMEIDSGEATYMIVADGPKPDTLKVYGQSGDKMFLATSSQFDFPFLLAEWKLGQIKKTPSEVMGKKDEEE